MMFMKINNFAITSGFDYFLDFDKRTNIIYNFYPTILKINWHRKSNFGDLVYDYCIKLITYKYDIT